MRAARVAAVLSALLLVGCSGLDYYVQSVAGHFAVVVRQRNIDALLADPSTPEALRDKLGRVQTIRRFAVHELGLPADGSYHSYADIGRDYVVWSVTATPELSLEPHRWCYPIVGCLSYRGFYELARAEREARKLRTLGFDVYVAPVRAYSTLGWFDDPVLNTLMRGPDWDLAGVIFHELTHRKLYVPGDTAFNEAYAMTVQLEGQRRWLMRFGTENERRGYATHKARRDDFIDLVRGARDALERLYGSDATRDEQVSEKRRILGELRARYSDLRNRWGGHRGYDRWFGQDLNNAKLALTSTYNDLVPRFFAMLDAAGGDMRAFHASVASIAEMDPEARRAAMLAGELASGGARAGGRVPQACSGHGRVRGCCGTARISPCASSGG